jgi:hypothetical protein
LNGIQEVGGSTPPGSTSHSAGLRLFYLLISLIKFTI